MKAVLEILQYLMMKQLKTLEALDATYNFIDICLKLLRGNINARCEAYINDINIMFRKIPQNIKISLTTKQKTKKLMTDIGGGWYMKRSARGIPPLRRTKLIKKNNKGRIKT